MTREVHSTIPKQLVESEIRVHNKTKQTNKLTVENKYSIESRTLRGLQAFNRSHYPAADHNCCNLQGGAPKIEPFVHPEGLHA